MYYIAGVGASQCDAALASLAEEVGSGMACRGGVLVCGDRGGIIVA